MMFGQQREYYNPASIAGKRRVYWSTRKGMIWLPKATHGCGGLIFSSGKAAEWLEVFQLFSVDKMCTYSIMNLS
jgi:hypothetical protein